MAVPKTTQTRYMDGSVQRTTLVSNPIPTSFFGIERVSKLCCEITGNIFVQKIKMKKRCRDGVTCVVLCTLPSIYLVCVVFGTAIPTSFYIFGKMFFILVGNIPHSTGIGFNSSSLLHFYKRQFLHSKTRHRFTITH